MGKGNNYNHKLPELNELKRLYFVDRLSTVKIATRFGVTKGAVKIKFKRYGIALRTYSEAQIGNKNTLGFRYSIEHKNRMSELHKRLGHKPPSRKGSIMSEEQKEKLRKLNQGEKGRNWKGGISFEPYPITWNRSLKNSIRKRDNHICQLCFKKGNAVHHIDYKKENCTSDNLINLCFGCNAKVNFNREYWTNYFSKIVKEKNSAIKKIDRQYV